MFAKQLKRRMQDEIDETANLQRSVMLKVVAAELREMEQHADGQAAALGARRVAYETLEVALQQAESARAEAQARLAAADGAPQSFQPIGRYTEDCRVPTASGGVRRSHSASAADDEAAREALDTGEVSPSHQLQPVEAGLSGEQAAEGEVAGDGREVPDIPRLRLTRTESRWAPKANGAPADRGESSEEASTQRSSRSPRSPDSRSFADVRRESLNTFDDVKRYAAAVERVSSFKRGGSQAQMSQAELEHKNWQKMASMPVDPTDASAAPMSHVEREIMQARSHRRV